VFTGNLLLAHGRLVFGDFCKDLEVRDIPLVP
jgi:hypothetical protein